MISLRISTSVLLLLLLAGSGRVDASSVVVLDDASVVGAAASAKTCLVPGTCTASADNDVLPESTGAVVADDAVGGGEASYNGVTSPSTYAEKQQLLGEDLGVPQAVYEGYADRINRRIEDARAYVRDDVGAAEKELCKNQDKDCAFWAVTGECETNKGYMNTNCNPVCGTCDKLHVKNRCPVDPDERDFLQKPGDLNKIFERIVSDPVYQQYEPVVLSRPSYAPGDTAENATYKIGIWMIMFENAMSGKEADRMIELGGVEGYERSGDVGDELPDGTYDTHYGSGRTSYNAWCNGECVQDPIAQGLMARVENITGVPETNAEYFQLLRYDETQYYQVHSDYINYQRERPCGVRILTFYFYLNDVEGGGGTRFPKLDATVMPKKGRAVLWPSVFDAHPNLMDSRADHTALPVTKGVKYGCNAWIHQRDFKTPNEEGCT